MKPKMSLVWFMVSLALGALLVVQWRNAQKVQVLNEKLQVQVEKLDQEAKAAKASSIEAEKGQQALRGEVRGLEMELNNTRAAYTMALQATNSARPAASLQPKPPKAEGGNPASFLKEMMQNPEMAKVMREQQKVMINMMYNPLFKELGLTTEESEKFKDMLLDRQMSAMTNAGGLMAADPEARKAASEKVAGENEQFEAELRNFLGDDRFDKYHDYTSTLGERMTLNMFAQQSALKPEQSDTLLKIMKEEKQALQMQDPETKVDPNKDWQKLFESQELMDRIFRQQEQVNARVLQRAQGLLSEEQLKQFAEHQKNQLRLQEAGMKMARSMMGPSDAGPGEAPQPVAPAAPGQP